MASLARRLGIDETTCRPQTMRPARSSGLGLLLVKAYYVAVLCVGMLYAAYMDPAGDLGYVYDFSMVRAIVQMGCALQALWMLTSRFAIARPFCIVSTLASIVLASLDMIVFGGSQPVFVRLGPYGTVAAVGLEYVGACLVVGYLALSDSVRAVLSRPHDTSREGPGNSWDAVGLRRRARTWVFWRDVAIYFIVFSFVGHWAEMLFCRLIVAGVFMGGYDPTNAMLWDQWLYPFSAEGTALAMVVLFLHPLKQRLLAWCKGNVPLALVASFLANALVCTAIDFATGITCNRNYELWDYRDMPFNFMGQVCLQNSLVYSVAATLIVWVLYPVMDRAIRGLPKVAADALFFGLVGLYAFEAALHFVSVVG